MQIFVFKIALQIGEGERWRSNAEMNKLGNYLTLKKHMIFQ